MANPGTIMHKRKKISILLLISYFLFETVSLAYNIQIPYTSVIPSKTSNFGMFRKYELGMEEFHNGIDLDSCADKISKRVICTAAPGKVVFARWGKYGDRNTYNSTLEPHSIIRSYGKTVIIDHGGGILSIRTYLA